VADVIDPPRGPEPDRDERVPRRRLLLSLALGGFAIALYLTLFQVGAFPSVWDPLFGEASSRVVLGLTDPVPDAAAGVLAYATEIVLLIATRGSTGAVPWRLLALGLVLSIGAVVSIVLIVVQPAVAHQWCALCICSAALSLALFALGIGEARAAAARVRRSRERGVALKDALRGARAARSAA
jgi:vitamin K epoxide reductase family protein